MTQLTLLVDDDLCFDCKACEIACKQENHVPVGLRYIMVIPSVPKKVGDMVISKFSPTVCLHCAKPACLGSCPSNAIKKRSDGIVLIDAELCIGCGDCISACPFSVIGINTEINTAQKCTMCVQRVSKGMEPACVCACPSGAIYFGDINEVPQRMRKERLQRRAK